MLCRSLQPLKSKTSSLSFSWVRLSSEVGVGSVAVSWSDLLLERGQRTLLVTSQACNYLNCRIALAVWETLKSARPCYVAGLGGKN